HRAAGDPRGPLRQPHHARAGEAAHEGRRHRSHRHLHGDVRSRPGAGRVTGGFGVPRRGRGRARQTLRKLRGVPPMSLINYASREINCKIVYYGPGLGGKTTNLEYVYEKVAPSSKGKLISPATE